MKTIRYTVTMGSYVEVEDDATLDEIEEAIEEDRQEVGLDDGEIDWVYDEKENKELIL